MIGYFIIYYLYFKVESAKNAAITSEYCYW